MDGMEFGKKLPLLIRSRGLKAAEVARLTGIPAPRFTDWKDPDSGRAPTLGQALRLARVLGVPLDYLADDDADDPPPVLSPAEQQAVTLTRALALSVEEVARRLAGNTVPTNSGVHSPEYAQPVGPEIELPFRRPAPSHKDAKRDDKRPEPEGTPKRRR
jgi:transcriptional regulator with XRE-family HTH domain